MPTQSLSRQLWTKSSVTLSLAADDTDILVLLFYHQSDQLQVTSYHRLPTRKLESVHCPCISIREVQEKNWDSNRADSCQPYTQLVGATRHQEFLEWEKVLYLENLPAQLNSHITQLYYKIPTLCRSLLVVGWCFYWTSCFCTPLTALLDIRYLETKRLQHVFVYLITKRWEKLALSIPCCIALYLPTLWLVRFWIYCVVEFFSRAISFSTVCSNWLNWRFSLIYRNFFLLCGSNGELSTNVLQTVTILMVPISAFHKFLPGPLF